MKISRRKFLKTSVSGGVSVLLLSNGLSVFASNQVLGKMKVSVVKVKGTMRLNINGNIVDPLSFRTFRPEKRNISEFHEAGVKLMSVFTTGLNCSLDVPYDHFGETWIGPGQYDFEPFDKQMELFIKNAPNTYFNVKFQLDTRKWWLDLHPEAGIGTYRNLVEVAAYEPWRRDALAYMKALIEHAEAKYGDKIYAYTPFCGWSTEWYMYAGNLGQPSTNQLRLAPYKKFSGNSLAQIPSIDELSKTSHGVFRDPLKDKDSIDYWKFHAETVADTIIFFAHEAKKILKGRKLIGMFYGYLLELSNARLLQEGHMAYEKVWNCPDIDMIYDIASYTHNRSFLGTSGFLSTIDSLRLKGKLCFHEIDITTHIAPTKVENGRAIPGSNNKLKDANETVNVLRREFAMTRAKGVGLWWFDFFGGYYYDETLMKAVGNMVNVQKRLTDIPLQSVAEIVAFGDVQSMYYVSQHAKINNDCLERGRDALNSLGAPYDIYDFGFLEDPNIPHDQYKLYIFLNAFKISESQKQLINEKVKAKGKTALWLYAPGYIQPNSFSVKAMSECVGMQLESIDGQEQSIVLNSDAVFQGRDVSKSYQSTLPVSPVFSVVDKDATVMGHYSKSGKPSLAYKQTGKYTAYYSGLGGVPASIIREIAREAGVHIYYEGKNPVYINNRLIGIHFQHDSQTDIHLRVGGTLCQLEELFDGGNVSVHNGKCSLPIDAGMTKLYLITNDKNKI